MSAVVRTLMRGVRRLDRRLTRRSVQRRILVDARTPVNFTMAAPIFRGMAADPRVDFFFTATDEPARMAQIYHEAPDSIRLIHPARAALVKFDAYIASDFMWAPLLRETARVQIFHGVGGKYGFDAPDRSMREWDRLFFVNERRLRNFVGRGAVDADSPAIRLVGMPKVDCIVDGTYNRETVLTALGLDASRPTVLYAPTWSAASSLNAMGVELIQALGRMPINLIMKLHDRSRDLRERYSGGIDWVARLQPLVARGQGVIAPGHDISPYLVASDLMITDHSSAGFEFLLRDRPIVRIHRPELIHLANIHADYVSLLASAARSVEDLPEVVAAVERGLADPFAQSEDRRRVAADLFYQPGGATARAIRELYDVIELEPAAAVLAAERPYDEQEQWQKSA
jgi:CDP-Glycerol:Poly(glycerophosphate) glycerophosphotransferase